MGCGCKGKKKVVVAPPKTDTQSTETNKTEEKK